MKIIIGIVCGLLCTSTLLGEIVTKTVEYKVGDATFEGFLAYDDAQSGMLPGIIVVHEWWGNNDYSQRRARELAELGYVAFAADMFGKGKTTNDPKQASAFAEAVYKHPQLMQERFNAAMQQLKSQPNVDPSKIGAIGYCFGGTVVMTMALAGEDLKGVVSFHGGLPLEAAAHPKNAKASILICNGADDIWVTREQIDAFKKSLTDAGVKFQFIDYPDAVHAFTNPESDARGMDNVNYNATADQKSWDEMKKFFAKVFAKN